MPLDLSLLKLANIFRPDPNQIGMDMPSQGGITGMMDRNSGPTFGVSATSPTFGDDLPSPDTISGNGAVGQPMSQMQSQPDLSSTIQQLLNPSDQQFKNYTDLIAKMPQRANYQPSGWRRVAALIGGLGAGGPVGIADGQVVGYKADVPKGLETQQMIKNAPYNKALSDWSNQLDPLAKAAQMEATRNTNLRQIGLGEMARQIAEQRANTYQQKVDQDKSIAEGKLAISQQRADIYKYKAEHPNNIIKEDNNGNLVAINPQTSKTEPILDNDGNPVKSSVMTDAEKFQLQEENRQKDITARGEQSRLTETLRQTGRSELQNQRAIDQLNLKREPLPARSGTTTAGNKPLTPSAERTALQNQAVKIINDHPELDQYFEKGANKLPTGKIINPTKNDQDAGFQIAQRLLQNKPTSDIQLGPKPTTQPQSQVGPSGLLQRPGVESPALQAARKQLEPGYVLLTKDGGKTFVQIPSDNVSKLKPELGYVVVK